MDITPLLQNAHLPRRWATLCFLLPLLSIHLVYLLAANAGQVPWCIPHIQGCTSISRAAREGIANPVFRATMLTWALMLVGFWWLNAGWLVRRHGAHRQVRWSLGFVIVSLLTLTGYAWFVGGESGLALWFRRYGGVLFFSCFAVAQFFVLVVVHRDQGYPLRLRRLFVYCCAALLVLGWGSIPGGHLAQDGYRVVSAIEWSFALLMIFTLLLNGRLWQIDQFSLHDAHLGWRRLLSQT